MHSILIGGTKGLGRVVAQSLSAQGHQVSVMARNPPEVELGKNISFYAVDLHDLEGAGKVMKKAVQDRGPVDNLIFLQRARDPNLAPEQNWQNELQISLAASKAVIEVLQDKFSSKGGSVVFVSSMGGSSFVDSQPLEYGIAKAGINHMVKHYSVQLGARQIRVNAVSCFTFLKDESKEVFLKNEKLQKVIRKVVPLQRMATTQDMAKAIGFFCSVESSFISGQVLLVDGGLSAVGQETIAFWASDVKEKTL